MSEPFIPRLCGGLFLSILSVAKRQTINTSGNGSPLESKKATDTYFLTELIRFFYPSFKTFGTTFNNNTAQYKSCALSHSSCLPFDNETLITAFDVKMKDEYHTCLFAMNRFVNSALETQEMPCVRLVVGLLLGLIEKDDSILETDRFIMGSGNHSISKKELLSLSRIEFQPLLLAVWHFILVNRQDNEVGRETASKCLIRTGDKGSKRTFAPTFGIDLPDSVAVMIIGRQDIRLKEDASGASANPALDSEPVDKYLKAIYKKYSKMKTLLYTEEAHPIDSFYVCSRLSYTPARVRRKKRIFGDLESAADELSSAESTFAYLTDMFSPSVEVSNATAIKLIGEFGNNLIITGTGGLGKSMMMKHLLLDAVQSFGENRIIPVFVPLKDYDDPNGDVFEFVYKTFSTYCEMEKGTFKRLLVDGNFLFLFDGLDEIKGAQLPSFERGFEAFSDKYSSNLFFLSSRPFKDFVSFFNFKVIELCPLDENQAVELINKLDLGADFEPVKKNFIERIKKDLYRTHKEFVTNPLLLTIMLITFEQFGEISSKMHIFYREAFTAMVKKHDATKIGFKREFKTGLSGDRIAAYFAEFCMRTYHDHKLDFTRRDIEVYLSSLIEKKRHPEERFSCGDFINDIAAGLCLMYHEGGKYHFTHRSFQEYFCAYYFSRQKDKTLERIGEFFENENGNRGGDLTFPMLYDMIPEKVEEYIFIPFLDKLFRKCDQEDGFNTYFKETFAALNYARGAATPYVTEPSSFLLPYILRLVVHDDTYSIEGLPHVEEYVTDKYAYMEVTRSDGTKETVLESLSGIFDDEGHPAEDSVEPDGYTYEVDVDEMYENPELNQDIIEKINEPDFPIKRDYEALRNWYVNRELDLYNDRDGFFDIFDD